MPVTLSRVLVLPASVYRLLERQHGLVTRRQLVQHGGIPPGTVERWVRQRALIVVHWGVYRLPGVPVPPEQRVLAAVLRSGRDARALGEAVLALLGVEGCALDCSLQVAIPEARHVTAVPFTVIRSTVSAADRAAVRRVPGTTVARAVLDAAATFSDKRVRQVVDSARWLGLLQVGRLVRRAEALPRHRGARRILDMYQTATFDPESEGERELQHFLGDSTGEWEWGVTDVVPGLRLDCYERRADLTLEYDGERDHRAQRDVFADRTRELKIRATGTEVIRITKEMLRDDRAATLVAIERILARRREESRHRAG